MNTERIGYYIKQKRTAKLLTQEELAEKLNITAKTVSRWERGLNIPDVSIIPSLAAELGTNTASIIAGEDITEDNNALFEKVKAYYEEKELAVRKKRNLFIMAITIVSIMLIDVCYGFFSTNLSWHINDRTLYPQGIIYTLFFGNEPVFNSQGVVLTRMLYLFIGVFALDILLIISLFLCAFISHKNR